MKNGLIFKQVRIGFFAKDILRVELKYRGEFCDENTFFVPERKSLQTDEMVCAANGSAIDRKSVV